MKKIYVFIIFVFLSSCSLSDSTREPIASISTTELVSEYKENEIEASIKYDEQFIEITGFVDSFSGNKDKVVMELLGNVTCEITNNIEGTVHLKKYDKIVLRGIVEGLNPMYQAFSLIGVEIVNCSFIEILDEVSLSVSATEFNDIAIEDYTLQIIEVTGIVYSVGTGLENTIRFDNDFSGIAVRLVVDHEAEISNLVKSDLITVRGTVINTMFGYELVNCVITKSEE